MAYVLLVTTLEIGNPIGTLVQMKADDFAGCPG
jgi:hypothetical protein